MYYGQSVADTTLLQKSVESVIHPDPVDRHSLCHFLHYSSVVYEVGALLQIVLFETHLVPDDNDDAVPEQGESEA